MLQCYDFVKCETCGINWDEHDSSCPNHGKRAERIAGQATLTDHDRRVLKAAGWTPPVATTSLGSLPKVPVISLNNTVSIIEELTIGV